MELFQNKLAIRFNFKIDQSAFDAVLNMKSLNLSGERIVNELQAIFDKSSVENRKMILSLLNATNLDTLIFGNKCAVSTQQLTFNEIIFMCVGFENLDTIKSKLTMLKFSSHTIDSVLFLSSLMNDLLHNNVINPMHFFKSTERLKIKSINVFGSEKIDWLFLFKPDKTLVKKLMDQGLKGAELGLALDQHHCKLFTDKFN